MAPGSTVQVYNSLGTVYLCTKGLSKVCVLYMCTHCLLPRCGDFLEYLLNSFKFCFLTFYYIDKPYHLIHSLPANFTSITAKLQTIMTDNMQRHSLRLRPKQIIIKQMRNFLLLDNWPFSDLIRRLFTHNPFN